MALKKGISYRWRFFFPVVTMFWVIIIGMAWWQVQVVREVKRSMVFDQLAIVGQRITDLYSKGNDRYAENFMMFSNDFYTHAHKYDSMSIQVRDNHGDIVHNIGNIIPGDFDISDDDEPFGEILFESKDLEGRNEDTKFLYYSSFTPSGMQIIVMLPYTRSVSTALEASTTKFWLILFGVGVFATIFAYISTAFFSRNIMILRDFARAASSNPHFVSANSDDFPHDELGEISHQILNIYNQRVLEMEQREREHKVALHAVEEKEKLKRELTSNINHELKTPVGVIQGYIDTIIDDPNMDPAIMRRFLEKTQQNVHRLTSLISDITMITRLESGGKLVNVTNINFHDLVFSFANFLEDGKLLTNGMTFEFDIPIGCMVLGNDSLLNAVLVNLTRNACKYCQGTVCGVKMVGEDDKFCYFEYYDDGIGVPPEHLPHLFERFYRVNAGRSRDGGGTGLGLAIVDVTIKSFGGEITAANRQPSGLVFSFSLPKWKPQTAPESEPEGKA